MTRKGILRCQYAVTHQPRLSFSFLSPLTPSDFYSVVASNLLIALSTDYRHYSILEVNLGEMASYYNPSKRLSEWAAALLSPYITLENEGNGDGTNDPAQHQATSLSVGLWSGNVELKNVQLRPETFEPFLNNDDYDAKYSDSTAQIKWKLIEGSISNVKIQIPWKGLLVGSAYSSAKCSALGNDTKEGTGEGKKKESPGKTQGEDESAGAAASGCTSIHIQGLKLLLGYEIIHHDPHLNALQSEHGQNGENQFLQIPHNCKVVFAKKKIVFYKLPKGGYWQALIHSLLL